MTRWQRPRYAQSPNPFHAVRAASGGSVLTECRGAWSASEVVDELSSDGVGSGACATEKCRACVEALAAKTQESKHSGEGG